MKNIFNRLLSVVLTVIMIIGMIPIISLPANAATTLSLAQLKEKFPHGAFWNCVGKNGNNQDGVTYSPCPSHSSTSTCNGYAPNGTEVAWQCYGFACKLGLDAYGTDPRATWPREYNLDNIKPGDIINYDGNDPGHTVFVIGVNGNTVTLAECNYNEGNPQKRCIITWGRQMQKSQFNNLYNVYSAPYALDGYTPTPTPTPDYHECNNCISVNKGGSVTNVSSVLNVRSGPGTSYEKVFELTNGTGLMISVECNGWYFVTDAEGNSGWVLSDYVEINGQETHSHNYTEWNYEIAPPHKEYMSCSCGAYQYTGENYFDEAYYISYYEVHPHYEVKVCNVCGWDHVEKTGGTRYIDSCTTCNPPHTHSYTTYHDATHPHREYKKCSCGNSYYLDSYYYDSGCTTCNPPKYTITFDANGGNWSGGNLIKTHDVKVTIPNAYPTRTGYAFQGWSTSRNGTIAYFGGETYTANSSITLYAVWKANTYTIKYNANGGSGSMSNSTHTYDTAKALTANAFTRSGYTFLGWSTSSSATSATYTDKQSVKNLTSTNGGTVNLYAVWKPNTYTVKYNANGGNGTMSSSTYTYDTAKALTANAFTRSGYTFLGWSTSSSATSATYTDKQSVKNLTSTNGGTVNLYAVWQANTYTVKYNANGGSGSMSNSSHTYDTAKELTANTFTRTGYTFKGWSTSASASSATYTDKQSVKNLTSTNSGTVTLYAVWQANTYTVKYNANGGSGSMSNSSHTYDASKALSANSYTKKGYTFKGWSTSSSAASATYTNKQSVKNLTSTNGGTVNLYAVWQANTYTITYNANGGNGTMSNSSHTYDVEKKLTSNVYTRAGYHFKGWSTSPTAASATYTDGQQVINLTSNNLENIKLYAVWEVAVIGIKFDVTSMVLEPHDIGSIEARIIPENAANKNITWISKDESVATVTDGKVTPHSVGSTVIKAITEDGGFAAECAVTVKVKVQSITLNKTSLTLNSQDSEQLIATVLPQNATNKNVTWSSSNTAVATISEDGTVTAKSKGSAIITATGDDGKSASCNLNVTAYVTGITLDKTEITIIKGDRFSLNARIAPFNADNQKTTWTVSDKYDFEISSSSDCIYLTPKYLGTYTVTVTTQEGGFSDTCTIKVIDGGNNWSYDAETTTLMINGSGNMSNYSLNNTAPWYEYRSKCTNIVFSDDITSIGSYAFQGFSEIKSIKLPDKLTTINQYAFTGCYGLVNIEIPYSLSTVDMYSFQDSYKLASVYYKGTKEQFDKITISIGNTYLKKATVYYTSMGSDIYITYNSNGGAFINTPKAHTSDLPITSDIPTYTGYVFCGWSDEKNGTVKYVSGDYYNGTTDITLYAVWEIKTYRIKYNANGGMFAGTHEDQIKTHGRLLNLNFPVVVRDGYRVCYWNTDPNCDGDFYNETVYNTYYYDEDLTLYAIWEKVESETIIIVTNVSLNKTSTTLDIGATETLTATVVPSNATNKTVTWISSNSSVASVSNGVITAKAAGTATITVKTADANKTATCTVTVKTPTVAVTGVSLNKIATTLTVGDTETLTATVTPNNATNKTVTWTSSNTNIASVSNGVITAKAAGTATITVKTADGNKTATCVVTVNEQPIVATDVIYTISSTSAKPGDSVEVTLSVASDVVVNGLLLDNLTYDKNVFEFVEFADYGDLITTSALGANGVDSANGVISLGYTEAVKPNGQICVIKFCVKDTAEDGEFIIGIDGMASAGGKKLSSRVDGGKITISKWVSGDFDSDEKLDMKDVVHFMNWINFSWTGKYPMVYDGDKDFNKDGNVDMKDVVYFMNWVNFSWTGNYDINW